MAPTHKLDRQLLSWVLTHNLDHIVRFHNALNALLREKYNDPNVAAEQHVRDTIQIYDRMNATNSFLLTFAFLEEMLYLLWKVKAPAISRPDKGHALERYAPVLRHLQVDPGTLPCWPVLCDAAKIRHCILHANGRVSIMRKPDEIRAIIKRHRDQLRFKHDRVAITSKFLHRVVTAIRELREEILRV